MCNKCVEDLSELLQPVHSEWTKSWALGVDTVLALATAGFPVDEIIEAFDSLLEPEEVAEMLVDGDTVDEYMKKHGLEFFQADANGDFDEDAAIQQLLGEDE